MKTIPHRHHAAGKRKIRQRLDKPVTAPSPKPVFTASNIHYEADDKLAAAHSLTSSTTLNHVLKRTLVAGGLVSRWFIERDGGNRVIRRLVMLGTPNGGFHWPNVLDWAATALTVGPNELSKVAWHSAVFPGLVLAAGGTQKTLGQFAPGSDFLKDLHANPDPKVLYVLIAGNMSLIAPSTGDEERRSRLRRLLTRHWSDPARYELANLLFGGSQGDAAVSLAGMCDLAGGRDPACEVRRVAIDRASAYQCH